ncbi:DUF1654 domain-containing protein [Pseudomonas tohonis]|uniref:DUF1654 domain-containing protein n=1 Tax=Pseudomonas tohonis TaxID=2725477 RepID=A0ABQ4VTM5_9PSED|nr:DUF1654 domain-containing protein [Pseudomonas tohonis]GJN50814.1 hypothetical protein TUM20286_05660 [Pseudomonas tohonis]
MAEEALQRPEQSSYYHLTRRVQLLLSTPRAQVEHQAVIYREPCDCSSDWDRLLEEIRDTEGVALTLRPDGSIHVAWFSNHC